MKQPESAVWNGLFWMIQLFICVNAVAKSFLQESRARILYYYTIAGAKEYVLSKLIYNAVLMVTMSLVSQLLFQLLLGNPLHHPFKFIGIVCLGSCSLSLVFTFLSAIAAKAKQNAALIAILGFPLVIPQILLLMKLSAIAFSDVIQSGVTFIFLLLTLMDIMVVALALILFPFLWKD